MVKRIAIAVALAVIVGIAIWQGYVLAQRQPQTVQQIAADLELMASQDVGRLIVSGIIEAHQVDVAPEVGGTIVELTVREGDAVEEGQLLARLDTALIDAQLAQAEAAVAVAQAHLDLAMAGAREVDVHQAEAAVRVAEAARDAAYQAWQDAQALLDNPQDLEVQLLAAQTEVAIAEKQVLAAAAQARALDEEHAMWGRTVEYLASGFDVSVQTPLGPKSFHVEPGTDKIQAANLQWNLSGQQAWEAWQAVEQAKADLMAAQARLRHLEAKRADLTELKIRVDAAKAAFHEAEAQLEQAKAALEHVREGATPEQVELARARVRQAESARDRLISQRAKFTLHAPRSGIVVTRPVHRGEVVTPGTLLLKIADLDQVTLTVYVPEDKIGHVRLGDAVAVSVDSFPGRTFSGRVTYIADRAEFTPNNVQTPEERINMVFAVKITLPNPSHDLKPGMPADADFGPIGG
ncbi:MAG: efflux RND transporter periplasmic adaptor subunit [Anaerolineae bacterium]|nr:efflux RND transporter periplasmic adaptor subunit [Anaerolineae bacterium]MDW8100234.1 efflux RND transporter periplasmic adaptor subunit [Anaerolineae bacterium]